MCSRARILLPSLLSFFLMEFITEPARAQGLHVREFREKEAARNAALSTARSLPPSDPSFDATYYDLDLVITASPQYLRGTVRVIGRPRVSGITSVTLDLADTMRVDSVLLAGTPVQFARGPATLIVSLGRTYVHGETILLDIHYRGRPVETGFGSFVFSEHGGIPWIWSLSEPYGARDWWPCKDHPSDKADSVDVRVTCDTLMRVGSNGRLLSVTPNGDGTHTWHWAERYPIATYLVSFALTNYAAFSHWFRPTPSDSMEVLNFVLPEHAAGAEPLLARTVDMLRIFSASFGLYPFFSEKYGHAEFGRGGAMEHQTMTSATYPAFAEFVVAHELAHQWWGDLITCSSWPHLWLNEGFATYSEAVYFEQQYGGAAYLDDILPKLQRAKTAAGTLVVTDTSDVRTLFNHALVYDKGAAVLHMLRGILGDSLFFASLRGYASDTRFRYGVATSADFQGVCESVAGRPLDWFFSPWLYGESYPRYSLSWTMQSDSTVRVRLDQTTGTTNPSFFPLPVELLLHTSAGDTTVLVNHTASGQEFLLPVPGTVLDVTPDPDHWLLADFTPVTAVEGDEAPADGAPLLLDVFPHPFNGSTTIRVRLRGPETVTLQVFDMLGREVARTEDRAYPGGALDIPWNAPSGASGVYFLRLSTPTRTAVRRVVLLR